jgi:hypothetical protein
LSTAGRTRLAKGLRWAGRIIALPVATFFLVFMIGEFVDSLTTEGLRAATDMSGLFQGVTILIAFTGGIISFWWLLPAGILLIFAYVFGAVSSGLVAVYHVDFFTWNQFRDFWTIPGIIYLVAGVLFLWSRRLSRQAR